MKDSAARRLVQQVADLERATAVMLVQQAMHFLEEAEVRAARAQETQLARSIHAMRERALRG